MSYPTQAVYQDARVRHWSVVLIAMRLEMSRRPFQPRVQ